MVCFQCEKKRLAIPRAPTPENAPRDEGLDFFETLDHQEELNNPHPPMVEDEGADGEDYLADNDAADEEMADADNEEPPAPMEVPRPHPSKEVNEGSQQDAQGVNLQFLLQPSEAK